MIRWKRAGKTVSKEGTTIIYEGVGTDLIIESRRRHIPHAGGRPGTWDCTTYFVLKGGAEIIEKFSLTDAKKYAETII
jgi:hypothetical protein